MSAIVLVVIVIMAIIVLLGSSVERFNDTCTTISGGDTDAIKQERLLGLREYEAGVRSAAVCGKKSASGGASVNLQTDSNTSDSGAPNTENALLYEQYQDFALSSAEDAAARVGHDTESTLNYGLDQRKITQQWSGEQLFREYRGDVCRGDQRMAESMRAIGMRAQEATLNRAAFDKRTLLPFVAEELDANENRQWWDDNQDLDAEMLKDGMPLHEYFDAA